MTNQERARLGGLALREKVSTEYFSFIGRRGGRNNMARQYREDVAGAICPDLAEHYEEKAAAWQVDTGTRIMVELWTKENCPPRPRRRPARTEDVMLRRWERSVKAW